MIRLLPTSPLFIDTTFFLDVVQHIDLFDCSFYFVAEVFDSGVDCSKLLFDDALELAQGFK